MAKVQVYVEVPVPQRRAQPDAMTAFAELSRAPVEAAREAERVIHSLSGFGLEVATTSPPVPLYAEDVIRPASGVGGFAAFATPEASPDVPAESQVVLCDVDAAKLDELMSRDNIRVFGFLPPELFAGCGCVGGGPAVRGGCGPATGGFTPAPASAYAGFGGGLFGAETDGIHPFDLARTAGGIDCRPFLPAVSMAVVRQLLAVDREWTDGFTGQNVVVAMIDEGVNSHYPVIGGFGRPTTHRPGGAPITSHGSMCAADVLVAAPSARLLDYPVFDRAGNGLDPLPVWQAVLNQRRLNGTPHLTNNSYGFYTLPDPGLRTPATEVNHPVNRKIREVVAAGVTTFFAAGNCGGPCADPRCNNNTGTPVPINGSNSLPEVITVAAVNSRRARIGYSSQGPGNFAPRKPDLAGYSHFFGNFGPNRPGGLAEPFDSGTSAATPVVCGVAALLLSAFPNLTPAAMAAILTQTAIDLGQPGWDTDTGFGVVNARAAYTRLRSWPSPSAVSATPSPAPGDADESETEGEAGPEAARPARRPRPRR
jgi:subtilisin family serine protease